MADVRAFLDRHELMSAVDESLQLVRKYFPSVQRISAELVHDPDADAEWVALNVAVAAPLGKVLDLDAAFLADWTATVGRHVLDRLVVMVYPADDGRS
jgi:hypothetical protein